jgi:hypothetical protein
MRGRALAGRRPQLGISLLHDFPYHQLKAVTARAKQNP